MLDKEQWWLLQLNAKETRSQIKIYPDWVEQGLDINAEFLKLPQNKEEQEVAESCNRLIKNAIICWNYMYLTQKLKRTESEEHRLQLLATIKNHSPISWAHINLLGEYDFSEERMQDSVGVLAYQKDIAI